MSSEEIEIKAIQALFLLSPRECLILKLTGEGYSADEIASELVLSVHTVRTHIRNIKNKLNLKGNRAIINWYRKNKIKLNDI